MDVNIHLNPERHVIIKEVKCGDFLNIENGAVYTIIVTDSSKQSARAFARNFFTLCHD